MLLVRIPLQGMGPLYQVKAHLRFCEVFRGDLAIKQRGQVPTQLVGVTALPWLTLTVLLFALRALGRLALPMKSHGEMAL